MISYILNKLYELKYNQSIKDINCRSSTNDNPFANYIITSKLSNPNISACKNLEIIDTYMNNLYINSNFAYNRYFFDKNYLDNNFITMPVSKYPNDIKKFANYLYNDKNLYKYECKEKTNYCARWRDIRFNKRYVK